MGHADADRRFRRVVGAILAVGLALRLVYALVVRVNAPLLGDALYYHQQAWLNTKGYWFADPVVIGARHHPAALVASAQHPPVFTLFLTLGDWLGLGSVTAQLVVICLVGTATILVTAVIARDLAGERAGMIAAAVACLYPGFWVFDGEVMSEALVMLLAALTILATLRCFRDCTPGRVAVLGLLCGLCALTRAELVLLIPLVALPTVLWQRTMAWRRRLGLCGLAVVVAVVPMAPWFARNLTTFHHPVWLSDQLPATLAASNNEATYYGSLVGSWCILCIADTTFPPGSDESDEGVVYDAMARRYIEAHKTRALEVAFERVGLVWDVYAPVRMARQDFLEGWPTPVSYAWMIWFYPLALLAVGGVVVLRRRRRPIYPLVAMAVVVSVASFVTYGNYRFRAEAEVAIVVAAAVALDAVWRRLEGPETEVAAPPPEPGAGVDDRRPVAAGSAP